MIDLLGHLFYAILFTGTMLLSLKKRWGWVLCFIGQAGWAVLGAMLGLTSIVIWCTVFNVLNIYGFVKWSPQNPKERSE